ncbi:hypothetical protein LINPERPRIM_LOCUS19884 [Linum perenne]
MGQMGGGDPRSDQSSPSLARHFRHRRGCRRRVRQGGS